MKKVKTCLRTPGGKFYGFKKLEKYFQVEFDEYREPFLGGGSVFLSLDNETKTNWINDIDTELVNFYKGSKFIKIKKLNSQIGRRCY